MHSNIAYIFKAHVFESRFVLQLRTGENFKSKVQLSFQQCHNFSKLYLPNKSAQSVKNLLKIKVSKNPLSCPLFIKTAARMALHNSEMLSEEKGKVLSGEVIFNDTRQSTYKLDSRAYNTSETSPTSRNMFSNVIVQRISLKVSLRGFNKQGKEFE